MSYRRAMIVPPCVRCVRVAAARVLVSRGFTYQHIGMAFGVTRQAVDQLLRREACRR